MYNYIGIDVSKQSLKISDETKEYDVPNEKGLKTLKKLFRKNYGKDWKETRLIYEPTGPYSNYLREFVFKHKIRIYEMNPKKSANFAKALGNRSKTDDIDAKMLYKFHVLLKEEDFRIPEIDKVAEQLGAYVSSYRIIQKTRTMLSNHLQSREYENGIDPKLKESIKKEMEKLKQIEEALEKKMEAFGRDNPEIKEDFENLLSIKGIGVISATALLYLFRKYPDANRNEITALAGLDPVKRQSGSSINGGRKISKAGDSSLRKILYVSCLSSIRYNDRIRVFYEHLITNHKKPKVALIACMRKILLIAHQIYVKKSEYKPLYIDNKSLCSSY